MVVLETENLELKEKVKRATTTIFKGKSEASRLQLDLENKLHTAEMKIKVSFERNHALERDLVRVKEELENSLKWTNSSKILTNILSQGNNIKGDLSCKRDCLAFKDCGESSSNYSKPRNRLKKGPGPVYVQQKNLQKKGPCRASVPKLKNIDLPHWTKNSLITPLSAYWELQLKWVPKANT